MVIRKIGRPARSRMMTKYKRLISEPKTICALESGVDSRMLNVWASRSCVIAPAVKIDAEHKPKLKAEELMTRDPRAVERKKFGRKKARKRYQFSKR